MLSIHKRICVLFGIFVFFSPSLIFAQKWTTKTSMPTARRDLTVSAAGDKIYAIGGLTPSYQYSTANEEYDPSLNSWTSKASIPVSYYYLKSDTVGGKIYVVGREIPISVYEYNPSTNTWTAKSGTTSDRSEYSLASANGKLYIFGGYDNNQTLDTVEEYDPVLETWTTKTSMPTPRSGAAAVAYNGKIYLVGGERTVGFISVFVDSVHVYDPDTDSWEAKGPIPTSRRNLQAQVVDGKLYAIGGYSESYESTVEEFDLVSETWAVSDTMLTARESFGTSIVNNKIYSVGGIGGASSSILSTNEEFNPANPHVPLGLTAVADDGEVNLIWNSNTDTDILQYNIYRSTTNGFSPVPGDSIGRSFHPDTTYTDNSVNNATTYYYRVASIDSNFNMSDYSNQVSATPRDTILPDAPANLAAQPDYEIVTLTWDANSEQDLDYYQIYRSLIPGFTPSVSDSAAIVLKPATSYIDSFLTNYQTYYYVISAFDSSGNESSFSSEVNATPFDSIAPAIPQNLTATGQHHQDSLHWNFVSDADLYYYKIYRSQTGGFTPSSSDSIGIILKPDSTYIDTVVIPGQTYYYIVSAVDSNFNESGFSNEASAVPIDTLAPGIPQNLAVTSGDRFLDLSWDSNAESDMFYYTIYKSRTNGFTPSSSDSIAAIVFPDSTYRDSTVLVDSTYYYVIAAVDSYFNQSDFSAQASGVPYDSTGPAAPQNLTATGGQDHIALVWDPNTENDLLKYIIYRNTSSGFNPSSSDSVTVVFYPDTTYNDSSVINYTTYYYKIAAVDSFNNIGTFSNEASASSFDTLAPAAPQNLAASSGNKQVDLIWDQNTEPDMLYYVVYRSLNNGFTPTSGDSIGVVTFTDTTYTDNSVFNDITYYYKVAAADSSYNYSDFSNQASATPAPVTDYTWQTKSPMNNARSGPISGTINGKIYTVGGWTGAARTPVVEEYDHETNTWAAKTSMISDREDFGGDVLDGHLYIVGGRTNGTRYTTVEAYMPETDSWKTVPSMANVRRELAVATANGKLYAIGGREGGPQYRDHVEEFNPADSSWTTKTAMTTARYGLAAAVVNNKIYLIGGSNAAILNTVEEYDPILDQWTAKTAMPTARRFLTATTISGKIYAIGGESAAGNVDIVEIYNPDTDSWTTGDSMLTVRYKHSAAAVNDVKIYAIGGTIDGVSSFAVNEEYNPPPWQPQDLTANFVTQQIELTWTANIEPDLSYYIVYRSQSFGFTPAVDDIIGEAARDETSFTDTNFVPDTSYYYVLAAVDSAGHESVLSSQASVTTPSISFQLGIPDTLLTNGDTLSMPLTFYGNLDSAEIYSFQFKISYDSNILNGLEVDTSGFGNPITYYTNVVPGSLKVAAYSTENLTGTNRSMTLTFEVDDDAARDTTYLRFSEAYFNEGNPAADTSSARIRIKPRYGDVTGDRTISAYDASYVLQYVVGLQNFSQGQLEKGDVTYNGVVSSFDAYYILLRVIGSISTFPVEDTLFSKISLVQNPDIALNISKEINESELTVKISANNVKNISSLYLNMGFNTSALDYKYSELEEKYADFIHAENSENGNFRLAMAGGSPIKRDGEILTLRFNIKDEESITDENILILNILEINDAVIGKKSIKDETIGLPKTYDLSQNYPNPFNPETSIKYQLPKASKVMLKIFNILGQEVKTLLNETKKAGYYNIKWDGRNNLGLKAASGIYIYRISAGEFIKTRKMVLLK
ncbi:kelch repeat-containing protein [candidate division KSB1 bacterium]